VGRAFVVGYDGSAAADDAVRLAERLGRAAGARVVAVNVRPPVQPTCGEKALDGGGAAVADGSREQAEELLARLDGAVERRAVEAASTAEGLEAAAREESAELIALGASRRKGRVRRDLLGRMGYGLLVVPEGAGAGDPQRIAAVDYGGDRPRDALVAAAGLAQSFDARLAVISAPGGEAAPDLAFAREVEERVERDLRQALGGTGPSIDADLTIVSGPPGPAVAQAAGQDVDVIVAGVPGEVADHLSQQPPCPVLLVPLGAGTA
jgi:nucleotide-binding universal stress UspA family protein